MCIIFGGLRGSYIIWGIFFLSFFQTGVDRDAGCYYVLSTLRRKEREMSARILYWGGRENEDLHQFHNLAAHEVVVYSKTWESLGEGLAGGDCLLEGLGFYFTRFNLRSVFKGCYVQPSLTKGERELAKYVSHTPRIGLNKTYYWGASGALCRMLNVRRWDCFIEGEGVYYTREVICDPTRGLDKGKIFEGARGGWGECPNFVGLKHDSNKIFFGLDGGGKYYCADGSEGDLVLLG